LASQSELDQKGLPSYVLDTLDIGVWAVDKGGDFIFFNKAMEEMTGIDRKEILGQNLFSVFGRLDRVSSEFKKRFFEAQESLTPKHYENLQFVRPDGSTGYQYGTFCPMKDEKGELLGMITIVEDVTDKMVPRSGEGNELHAGNRDLLVDMMLSDILNPLSVIMAYAEVMMEEETREDKVLDLKTIKRNAEKISNLLRDLTGNEILKEMKKGKRKKE